MALVKRDNVAIYYETHGSGTPLIFFCETACAGDIWHTFQVPEFSPRSLGHHSRLPRHRQVEPANRAIFLRRLCRRRRGDSRSLECRSGNSPRPLDGRAGGAIDGAEIPGQSQKDNCRVGRRRSRPCAADPVQDVQRDGRMGLREICPRAYLGGRLDTGIY